MLIKVSKDKALDIDTKRELKVFKKILRKKNADWSYLPRFFSTVKTNKGDGIIIEKIIDYDGNISQSLQFYVKQEGVLKYRKHLNKLRDYLINEEIVFNYDLKMHNILVQKFNHNDFRLVVIDGIGEITFLKAINNISFLLNRRLRRRWERFENEITVRVTYNKYHD